MKNLFIILFSTFTVTVFGKNISDSLQIPKLSENQFLLDDCDACGCSAGGASSGFESILNPQFIGVKYLNQHYKSKIYQFESEPTHSERYNTLQLWARIPVWKKLEIYASVPYHFHEKEGNPKQKINGIGDISVMAIYQILNTEKIKNQKLHFGLGMKIPTGKFNEANASSFNPSFQLGTGSWDYSAIVNYTYFKNNFAAQITTDYTFKNQNEKYYRFGDQWNSQLNLYYILNYNNWKLSPKIGVQYEKYFENVQLGDPVHNTGGYTILGKAGLEASFRKINIGAEFQNPFVSKLNNNMVEIISRNSLYINLNF